MEFDLENPFTSLEKHQPDTLWDLLASESDHMPSQIFLQCLKISDFYVFFRQEAAQFSCNFEPFISYLAITYLDRFISGKEIQQGKSWVLRLIVVSCISLAAKMKNTDVSLSKFQICKKMKQGSEGFIFDAQTIHRMELLVLDALNWRMRSITPFSFLCFFISLFDLKDLPLTQALKDRATDIVFKAHNEIKLLEFKPSVIAASAVLLSSHELFPLQFPSLKTSILSCEFVNKENLLKCFDTMHEMVEMEGYEFLLDTMSNSRTPLSLMDYQCTKSKSEKIIASSITTATVIPERREIKRRKMNGFCTESRLQLSRIQHC